MYTCVATCTLPLVTTEQPSLPKKACRLNHCYMSCNLQQLLQLRLVLLIILYVYIIIDSHRTSHHDKALSNLRFSEFILSYMAEFASLDNLPLDVHIHILLFLPDFRSLRCAVLASKGLSKAYNVCPNRIREAIRYTELGPTLPYLLVSARLVGTVGYSIENLDYSDTQDKEFDHLMNALSNAEDDLWELEFADCIEVELDNDAGITRRLESLYWVGYVHAYTITTNFNLKKFTNNLNVYSYRGDPTSPRLTDPESVMFHTALYRLWILSSLSQLYTKRDSVEMPYFSRLSNEDLANMDCVYQFLHYLAKLDEAMNSTGMYYVSFSKLYSIKFDSGCVLLQLHRLVAAHMTFSATDLTGSCAILIRNSSKCGEQSLIFLELLGTLMRI